MRHKKKDGRKRDTQRTLESQAIASRLTALLQANNLSVSQLARDLECAHSQLYELRGGKRNITPLLALKLAVYFGQDPLEWMLMQVQAELAAALQANGAAVARIKPLKERA